MRRTHPVLSIPRRKPASAFTLIEILLATLIASLILGATYSVYLAASQSWNRSRSASFNYQYARATFSLLEQHLRCALPPDSKTGITFEGLDTDPPETTKGSSASSSAPDAQNSGAPDTPRTGQESNSDSADSNAQEVTETLVDVLFPPEKPLDFRTTSPQLKANDTNQETWLQSDSLQFVSTGQIHGAGTHNRADLCELRFFLAPPTATELPRLVMLRNIVPTGSFSEPTDQTTSSTTPLTTQDAQETQTQSSQQIELAPNIVSFDVVYFDGTEWVAEWKNGKSLPQAVEIALVFADPDGVSNPVVLTKLVSLNLASAPENEAADTNGTTEKSPNNPMPPTNNQAPPPPQGAPPPTGGQDRR
jgi:type II secretory pathway pseudopilin PulG